MPSCWATRRASSTSDKEQQPESLVPPQSFIVAPTTSWPCSSNSAAATDESTPPDIATKIFIANYFPNSATSPPLLEPPSMPDPHRDLWSCVRVSSAGYP